MLTGIGNALGPRVVKSACVEAASLEESEFAAASDALEPESTAAAAPASDAPAWHCPWIVCVSSAALHAPPSTTGPSPTVSVTETGPTAVQVKFVEAAVGVSKEPPVADHA